MTFLRFRKMPATLRANRTPGEQQHAVQRNHCSVSAGIFTMRTRSLARTETWPRNVLRLQAGAMPHGERDGGDDGDEQQHRRQLERIEILGVQQLAERLRVAVALDGDARRRFGRSAAETLDPHDAADLDHDQRRDQDAERRIARETLRAASRR